MCVILFWNPFQQDAAVGMAGVHDSFGEAVDQMAEDAVTGQFDVEYLFGGIDFPVGCL